MFEEEVSVAVVVIEKDYMHRTMVPGQQKESFSANSISMSIPDLRYEFTLCGFVHPTDLTRPNKCNPAAIIDSAGSVTLDLHQLLIGPHKPEFLHNLPSSLEGVAEGRSQPSCESQSQSTTYSQLGAA
jgi:hypothetical protein